MIGLSSIGLKIIRLKTLFIKDKNLRRKQRQLLEKQYIKDLIKKYKWGISYSVFDGEELLEASIKSVRKNADYINVVYQKNSWYGEKSNNNLLPLLQKLKEQKLIDELIEYIPNYNLSAGKQERAKRNIGLKAAYKHGCRYFMTMDTDEFYLHDEVEMGKEFIIKNNVTHAFCAQIRYAQKPTQMILDKQGCFGQFFSRIYWFSKLEPNKKAVVLTDPTRRLSHYFGAKYRVITELRMHHMTLVRKNLVKKLQNSSCKNTQELAKQADNINILTAEVPDIFGLGKLIS